MKLYELTIAAQQLADALEETGGELTAPLLAIAEQIEGELPVRVDGLCRIVAQMKADEEGIKQEMDRLGAMLSARRKAQDRLKDYLKANLERMGIDKIKAGVFSLSICKSPISITWNGSIDELPEAYRKVSVDVNRDAIKEDIRVGADLPSQVVVKQSTHLRIR